MSQHPSLRVDSVGSKHRNVLKRFERIKKLDDVGKWEGKTSIFGLPKVKSMKIKVKKTKEAPAEEAAAAGTPGQVPTPSAATQAAKGAKPAAAAPSAGQKPQAGGAKPGEKGKK